jgi:hypothetical protein
VVDYVHFLFELARNEASHVAVQFCWRFVRHLLPPLVVDNLVGAGDGVADCCVGGGGEERTSPKLETSQLAAASSAEARNGT